MLTAQSKDALVTINNLNPYKGDIMKKIITENLCWKRVVIIFTMTLLFMAVGIHAEDAGNTKVKIERVALFKNGLGHFTSSAIMPKEETIVKIGQLPVPSFGTFWVSYSTNVKVRALITRMEDVKEMFSVRSIIELLQANSGRKVTISTNSKDMPVIKGTIVKIIPNNRPIEPQNPYLMDRRRSSYDNRFRSYQIPPLIIIKTESGTVTLSSGTIICADFENNDITTSVSLISKQPSIRIELEKEAGGEKIGINYLARGITWSPSYMIDISDPKIARLSAKALVINEVADINNVNLDLVTGFPNIQFGEVNSPVAMSQNLEGFLKALTTGRSESSRRGHMMRQQAMISNVARYGDDVSTPMPGYSTAREGSVSEDLFLYPVENFTLLKGETACIPLFTAEVPYKHIYIWKIPDMLDNDERYQRNRTKDKQQFAEEVWHSCRLVNNMKMPWTTAAAEFVKDGQFTGQDVCYYTAPGTETTIRINRAMNVLAEKVELELERKRNATRFHGYSYDLVKIKGELKLQNRLDKSVIVEITKNLSGEVIESEPKAKDIPTAKGLKQVNPRHILVWEIELKPGQKETLSYTYEVYVRN